MASALGGRDNDTGAPYAASSRATTTVLNRPTVFTETCGLRRQQERL